MVNINTYSFVNILGKSVLKANLFIKHENNKVFQPCAWKTGPSLISPFFHAHCTSLLENQKQIHMMVYINSKFVILFENQFCKEIPS